MPEAGQPAVPFTSEYHAWLGVPETLAIPVADRDLIQLPTRRSYRTLNRTGLLAASVCLPAAQRLRADLEADPFCVGIYCAVEPGPADFRTAHELAGQSETSPDFPRRYRRARRPRAYLRQLPNLIPAQIAIFLGIRGPICTFTHTRDGALHALDQARFDLEAGRIRTALICAAFSFEDPIVVQRVHRDHPARIICEGAAALVTGRAVFPHSGDEAPRNFGIADPLVRLIQHRPHAPISAYADTP